MPQNPTKPKKDDRRQHAEYFQKTCPDCEADVPPVYNAVRKQYEYGHCDCEKVIIQKAIETTNASSKLEQHRQWMTLTQMPARYHSACLAPQDDDGHFQYDAPGAFRIDRRNQMDEKSMLAVVEYIRHSVTQCRYPEQGNKALNLILTSVTRGNGKTHLAAAIINEHIRYAHQAQLNPDLTYIGARLANWRWIRAVDLIGISITDKALFEKIKVCSGLVIDDVGQESVKQDDPAAATYMHQVYFSIIDARYNAQRPTVITTNLSPSATDNSMKLSTYLGSSGASRIAESGLLVQLRGPDQRKGGMQSVGF